MNDQQIKNQTATVKAEEEKNRLELNLAIGLEWPKTVLMTSVRFSSHRFAFTLFDYNNLQIVVSNNNKSRRYTNRKNQKSSLSSLPLTHTKKNALYR